MTEPLVIGCHGCNWVPDVNTKMITLDRPPTSGATGMKLNGVDYQVPVGKKFVILSVSMGGWQQYAGVVGCTIYKGATSAALTTALVSVASSWSNHTYDISAGNGGNNIECYIEVEAGQFVNASSLSTAGSAVITGVETNV
mgnify:FL=1